MTAFAKRLIKETASSRGHFIVRTWQESETVWRTYAYSRLAGREELILDPITSDSEARALERHQQWAVMLEHQEYLVPERRSA